MFWINFYMKKMKTMSKKGAKDIPFFYLKNRIEFIQ